MQRYNIAVQRRAVAAPRGSNKDRPAVRGSTSMVIQFDSVASQGPEVELQSDRKQYLHGDAD